MPEHLRHDRLRCESHETMLLSFWIDRKKVIGWYCLHHFEYMRKIEDLWKDIEILDFRRDGDAR